MDIAPQGATLHSRGCHSFWQSLHQHHFGVKSDFLETSRKKVKRLTKKMTR